MNDAKLVLDANVFIAAKNSYYAFDICPGFWEALSFHNENQDICSIDRTLLELRARSSNDPLVKWIETQLSSAFFVDTDVEPVIDAYRLVLDWVNNNPKWSHSAKSEFATVADSRLIAYAFSSTSVIVTNERSRPDSVRKIFIPDVCNRFDIDYMDTFDFLRELGIRFERVA